MISLEKINILAPLQKLPKNMGDSGKLIVAAGFEIVAQSPINRPIWSHWLLGYFQVIVCDTSVIINTHIVL